MFKKSSGNNFLEDRMLEADNLHNMLQMIILVKKNAISIPEFWFQVQKSNTAATAIWNFNLPITFILV